MDFDKHAHQYDADLEKGIRLSGESKDFFARERLFAVQRWFTRTGFAPRRILEFGCGVGTNISPLLALWPDSDVVGIDVSEESLAIARQRFAGSRVRFETPDVLDREGPSSADWVFCTGVVHHIPVDQRSATLRFLRHQLRDGGHLTIFENNPFNPGARWVMRRIPFDRDAVMVNPYGLSANLRTLGFERVFCRFFFIFPAPLSHLRILEPWLGGLPLGAQYGVFAVARSELSGTGPSA